MVKMAENSVEINGETEFGITKTKTARSRLLQTPNEDFDIYNNTITEILLLNYISSWKLQRFIQHLQQLEKFGKQSAILTLRQ